MVTKQSYDDSKSIPTITEKLEEWERERNLSKNLRNAVYVSTPITTGPLFFEWLQKKGQFLKGDRDAYETSLKADVILPNIQKAAAAIELLRWHHTGMIINPTGVDVPGWGQSDYHEFWTSVLRRYAQRVIFLGEWQYSSGCSIEFMIAKRYSIDCLNERLEPISADAGEELIEAAVEKIEIWGGDPASLERTLLELKSTKNNIMQGERSLYKDEVLDHIANSSNVAQFVSFAPEFPLRQRYSRINGYQPNHKFATPVEAINALLTNATEKRVNIRSFSPETPEGNPFIKQLDSVEKVLTEIRKLSDGNLYTIVNEVIDESDGGVSGVCHRGLIEFAPDSTPRCVDDPNIDTAVFPFELGMAFLEKVYGFEPDLRGREGARVEFSIHPKPRGWRKGNTIIWQSEQRPGEIIRTISKWPNSFSKMVGDKTYGLLAASAAGFWVPRTVVFSDRLFPFVFGKTLGTNQFITRTCPEIKEPGYYISSRGWYDPYAVLKGELLTPNITESNHTPSPLKSVIIQQAVAAVCSGRALCSGNENLNAENSIMGVYGEGDAFMLGNEEHQKLPIEVIERVTKTVRDIENIFGVCSIEWVFDGEKVWVVQLNSIQKNIEGWVLPKTENIEWKTFHYGPDMIESFRKVAFELQGKGIGINVIGKVSPLSHIGEIAEIYKVPIKFNG